KRRQSLPLLRPHPQLPPSIPTTANAAAGDTMLAPGSLVEADVQARNVIVGRRCPPLGLWSSSGLRFAVSGVFLQEHQVRDEGREQLLDRGHRHSRMLITGKTAG